MNFDSSVLNVSVEDIIPNRFQPRLVFDDASLMDLAKSIKEHGIIQPLVLRKFGDKYEIVAGERRYKAAQLAGLASVPAVISKIDDKTSAEVAIAENVQRKQLSAIEEAKSYKALLDLGYMSIEQLAGKIGVSVSSLNTKLKLLSLSPEVQDAIMQNKISERHGRSLLAIPNTDDQVMWLHKIIDERLTVRQLDEQLNQNYKGGVNDMNIDINQVKQNAMDIQPMQDQSMPQNNFSVSNSMDMGAPIDLGSKQTNKFFNNLEDTAVSMQMTEAINPLLSGNEGPNLGFATEQVGGISFNAIDTSTPAPVLGPPTVEEPTVLPSTPTAPSLFDSPVSNTNEQSLDNNSMFGQVLSSPDITPMQQNQMPDVMMNNQNNQLNMTGVSTPSVSSFNDISIPTGDVNNINPMSNLGDSQVESLDFDVSPSMNNIIPNTDNGMMGLSTPNIDSQMNTTDGLNGGITLNPMDASAKISTLIEELKSIGYNIQMSNMDMPDQMLINIVLKK